MIVSITIEPWGRQLHAVIGETDESLKAYLTGVPGLEEEYEFEEGNAAEATVSERGHILLRFGNDIPHVGLVAHECLHACIRILRHVGVTTLNVKTEEVFCYQHEYIVKQVYEQVIEPYRQSLDAKGTQAEGSRSSFL